MNALLGLAPANSNAMGTNALATSAAQPYGLQDGYGTGGMFPTVNAPYATSGIGDGLPSGTSVGGSTTPQNAFDIFRNSTGYQFRLNEGMNALNSGYAGAGVVQSGAAMKSALKYGQDYASNEFGNYLGYLGNQQGVGLSGASALAGVGQNYANSVMANNNSAGSAAANAALMKGANNPFANMAGMIGGAAFQYGMR